MISSSSMGSKVCSLVNVQDVIVKGDLEVSVIESMPKVKYNMTTGEWVVMKCHPETMFACVGIKEGCTYLGKPVDCHFKGEMIHQCNWVNKYLMCLYLNHKDMQCNWQSLLLVITVS